MEGSDTADFMIARFRLKPGRNHEDAFKTFRPDKAIQKVNEDSRRAAGGLGDRAQPATIA